VVALAAGENLERLSEQMLEFQPQCVSVSRPELIAPLRQRVPGYAGEIVCGAEGLLALADSPASQTVIVGLVGMIGLAPTLKALEAGKKVLTANKETFVAGGHLVAPYLAQILPIDSEHSAIHQCLKGEPPSALQTIYLTASGGPFRTWSAQQLESATVADALRHPNWVMGRKITVDSATLMNKGLEVIEAHWLFGLPYDRIRILVHPQSIVHSGVELVDGSVLMQLGAPDMHGPIQYAMAYPDRLELPDPVSRLDVLGLSQLQFEPPDTARFPCIRLAYEAGRLGSSATAVLNAADEAAVALFLAEQIRFVDIARLIEETLARHVANGVQPAPDLAEIYRLDDWARQTVSALATQSPSGVHPR
jgi:1-deoxy-D-xylulose-5-phosphate reductoisomerase